MGAASKMKCLVCGKSQKVKNPNEWIFAEFVCTNCKKNACKGCGAFRCEFVCTKCKHCANCRCSCVEIVLGAHRMFVPSRTVEACRCNFCGRWKNRTPFKQFYNEFHPSIKKLYASIQLCSCRRIANGGTIPAVRGRTCLINKSKRPVGFELELSDWGSGYTLDTLISKGYDRKRDASVLPSQQELVSPPLMGDALVVEPMSIVHFLGNHHARVNDSCGLHVHVDSRDFSGSSLKNVLLIWASLEEDILVKLCDASRTDNDDYCQRLITYKNASNLLYKLLSDKSANPRNIVQQMLYGIDTAYSSRYAQRGDHYNHSRYYALNLHSLFYRGTIEFRCKEALLDPRQLVSWIMFCKELVEISYNLPENKLYEIVEHRDVIQFTKDHMPKWLHEWAKEVWAVFKRAGGKSLMEHIDRPRRPQTAREVRTLPRRNRTVAETFDRLSNPGTGYTWTWDRGVVPTPSNLETFRLDSQANAAANNQNGDR